MRTHLLLALLACGCWKAGPAGNRLVTAAAGEEAAAWQSVLAVHPDAEWVRGGPHWHIDEQEAARAGNPDWLRPGDCTIRLVFRANDHRGVRRLYDWLVPMRDGRPHYQDGNPQPQAQPAILAGMPNVWGDDWVETVRQGGLSR